MISKENIEAVILAGGKSSRMGQDKGFVELNGKPLIMYVIELLQSLKIPFRIGSHLPAYKKFGFEVIGDLIPGKGPIGGLYTALQSCTSGHLLLLSCDSPFISCELISKLLLLANRNKINVPVMDGKSYPLCSLYPASVLSQVKAFIESDNLRMKTLIENLPHKFIPMDRLIKGKESTLSNFNFRSEIDNYNKLICHGS